MDPRAPLRDDRSPPLGAADGWGSRNVEVAGSCSLALPQCPYRGACEGEASSLARARAGSRADFDALYDRYFAVFYRVASERFRDRALAEAYTRELMKGAFCAPAPSLGCAAGRLLRLVRRLGAKSNGRIPRTLA